MLSNGNSFGNGQAMDLGTAGGMAGDGTKPPSARWMFAVLVFKL